MNCIKLYFFILSLLICFQAIAQGENIEITRISRNDSTNLLDIYVSAPPGPNVKINANTIRFLEEVPGKGERECTLEIVGFTDAKPEGFVQESVTILFLLDYSGSMKTDNRLGKSKETIKEVISQISLPVGSKFELAAFHDDVFESIPINKYNIDKELAKYPTPVGGGKDTDLFRAMIEKIDELSFKKGKKILVLLSDGRNDNLRNKYYEENNLKRPTANEVYKKIKFVDLSNELMVLTYGIGNGIDSTFLKELPALTEAIEDKHYFTSDPRSISKILVDQLAEYNNDYRFQVNPRCKEYRGELRNLLVEWRSIDRGNQYDSREYKLGSSIEPVYVGLAETSILNWFLYLIIGIALVFGLLFLFIFLIPKLQRREFLKKYVVTYTPENNKIKRDPITQDIIQEGEKVVKIQDNVVTLNTWDALGYGSNVPDFMEFQDIMSMKGLEEVQSSFFSQKGRSKIYNWLWFGSLGGLLAWIFYSGLLRITELEGLNNFIKSFFNKETLDPTAKITYLTSFAQNTNAFLEQTLQGGILGTFLIASITVAEELGSTRKISPVRIGMRVLIGVFISFVIFGCGFVLQYSLLNGEVFFSGLITWLVFGILFGIILSLFSSIEIKKGILGGLVSCFVAYLVYYGILELVPNDELAKLLSFILLGGILGALLVKVIASLENYELIYLTPHEYNGVVKPISKWLKNGMEVYIGTSAKCYVFVKWNDEHVEDKHAMLILENGRVHIIALHETLLNGVIIPENQKVELNNDDIILLGRNSVSKMQYKER